MMIYRVLTPVVAVLCALCSGCSSDSFNVSIVEAAPMKIDAEYVTLTGPQVECGVREELWEAPVQSGDRSTARLAAKGRDLKFAEDVSIGDQRLPYVQIRGEFPLKFLDSVTVKDGPEKETKLIETKVGAIIQHACFPAPLPIMGVRHGKFTQDYPPVFFYRLNNGWQFERVVH